MPKSKEKKALKNACLKVNSRAESALLFLMDLPEIKNFIAGSC